MRVLRPTVLVLLVLAAPAGAATSAIQAVEQVYAKSATIPPCRFSSATLAAALRAAPTYDVEYAGDFGATVQATLAQQAGGRCMHHRAGSTFAGPVPGLTPQGRSPSLPGSAIGGTGGAIPLPLLLALIAGFLAALAVAVVAVTRRLGSEPAWADSARHAWGEAEYRLAGTWAEFRDWLRAS